MDNIPVPERLLSRNATTIYNHVFSRSTCQGTTISLVCSKSIPRHVGIDLQAKSVICEAYYINTTLLSWRELQGVIGSAPCGGQREGAAGNENNGTCQPLRSVKILESDFGLYFFSFFFLFFPFFFLERGEECEAVLRLRECLFLYIRAPNVARRVIVVRLSYVLTCILVICCIK